MLDIIANMLMVVPGVGVGLFGVTESLSKFAFPDDKPTMNLVEILQTTLKDRFDAQAFKVASDICDEIATSVSSEHEVGMFKSADWSRKSE